MRNHKWLCVFLSLFNLTDALLTHRLLMKGAIELNPLMRTLYDFHPWLFLSVKIMFSALILLIGFVPLRKKVQRLIDLAFVVYFGVICWHVYLIYALQQYGVK